MTEVADHPQPQPPPDGHSTAEEVRCPLCDYDLRGLTEPRCPECGYRFDWSDLTDPTKRLHPYLFEHHPRRSLWSFARTMLGGLRPPSFWSSLRPSQPSRPARLLLYWLLAIMMLPVGYGAVVLRTAVANAPAHRRQRDAELAYQTHPSRRLSPAQVADVNAWADEQFPRPFSLRYLRSIYNSHYAYWMEKHVAVAALYVAWPWLTLMVMLIFRASMRRAKVRTVHVLRCALYCCDAGLWLGTAAVVAVPALVRVLELGRYIAYRDVAVAVLAFAPVTAWRLAAAYRHYLRFDHPLATAAAVQLIVLLSVLVFLYVGSPRLRF
jgi:hypothetical protein